MKKSNLLFIILCFCSIAVFSQAVTDSLLIYYSFDTDATDGSLNGHDGTVIKTVDESTVDMPVAEGKKGNCLDLSANIDDQNPNDNIIVLTPEGVFDPSAGDFSAAFWTSIGSSTHNQVHMNQKTDLGRSILFQKNDGKVGSYIGGANTFALDVTAPQDEWFHLAMTYTTGEVKVYYNGELKNTAALTAEAANGAICIGSHKDYKNYVIGKIDELYIFTKALSDKEIGLLYADTNGGAQNIANLDNITDDISVYNTANGEIKIIKNVVNAEGTLTITDLLGKVVYQKSLAQCPNTFMVEGDLTPGIYVLYIEGRKPFAQKIMIK